MGIVLRSYQKETLDRVIQNYKENKRRNLCVLGTGLGKTICATELHKRFHKEYETDGRTLFIVDRIELAYQTKEAFLKSDPNLKVGIEMNTHHAKKTDEIVVACSATIGRKGSYRIGKFEPEDFSLIVYDEAHRAVTDTATRILNYYGVGCDNLLDGKMLVGLTATPNRTDGLGLGKAFDEITVNYDLKYAIKNGWLVDIDILQVETGTDLTNVQFSDTRTEELGKALNNEIRNKLIYKAYKEISDGEQGIIYASTVEHAYGIAEIFNANGISAKCIEANTDSKERKDAIREFRRGNIKLLTNYGTLVEGVNFPEISTVILARPIKSELLLRQIIGRGLRTSEMAFIDAFKTPEGRKQGISDSIKPSCKVVDLYDVLGEHSVVSIPSLFGLNEGLKLPDKQERFFQEVVEPLEELEREKGVDISKIDNLDDIDMIVKNQRLNIEKLRTPQEISDHTSRPWLPVGDDKYEIVYSDDKKTLIVQKNQLDKFEVLEYDARNKITKKLQDFHDLSSAIKLGDEYANEYYDTRWVDTREDWEYKGVTRKQMRLLTQLYKGGIRVDRYRTYSDTEVPLLYWRKSGEKLDQGTASDLISKRFNR